MSVVTRGLSGLIILAALAVPAGAFTIQKLRNFSQLEGPYPEGPITMDSAGNFFVTTTGQSKVGRPSYLFRMTPVVNKVTGLTQYKFMKLFDMNALGSANASVTPFSGALYGYSNAAGNKGGIFEMAQSFLKKPPYQFHIIYNFAGPDGIAPRGRPIVGPGLVLYGVTAGGGTASQGTIFKFDLQTHTVVTLHSFQPGEGAAPGETLTLGSDGNLYGTTQPGIADGGSVFRLNPTTLEFTSLYLFPRFDKPASATVGAEPGGPVAMVGNAVYGTTLRGGASNKGTLFKIDLDTLAFTSLHVFAGPDGERPQTNLSTGPDGALYGTTESGGAGLGADHTTNGTIFRFDPQTQDFSTYYSFEKSVGVQPAGGVMFAPDGAMYGTTSGLEGSGLRIFTHGTVWRLAP